MGRTAIEIAVDNENNELVELLLQQDDIRIGNALLCAIREGSDSYNSSNKIYPKLDVIQAATCKSQNLTPETNRPQVSKKKLELLRE